MDQNAITEYVGRCQQLIESSPQMDEENTKVKLVQPFLELLGWNLYSTEIALEYTVPMASGSTHVDYALLVGDTPVVFVEAKPVRDSLTGGYVAQLRSYMRQELDVDWGVLTNGQSFEVLTKSNSRNGEEEVSVVQFDLGDLTEDPGVLELLSKESIRSGKSDEIAEQVAQTNRTIQYLRKNEDSVTESVAETVENEVGDLTIDIEVQAREFVQSLVSVLREQRQFVSDSSLSSASTETEPVESYREVPADSQANSGSSGSDKMIEMSQEPGGYIIQFSDNTVIPESDQQPHKRQKQNMGAAIDYLVGQYDLIDAIEVPHFPSKAKKNCSINTDPIHPNGEDMRIPYELSNGYYLHSHLSRQAKISRIRDLAEQVGLSVSFLGEWK